MSVRARHMVTASAVAIAVVATLASCGGASAEGSDASGSSELVVLGAASLTDAFHEIAEDFETSHEGVDVALSFGPSDGLATQIVEGAPADVFASASGTWMDAVEQDGPGVQHRADFVRNRLTVITPPDDPAEIDSIEDLGESGVSLVLAAEDVPAGSYAREALANAGVAPQAEANVVSNEEDVKAVVQKVVLGEADAGIVYVTDVTPQVVDEIRQVDIPGDVNVVATYPIGVIADTDEPDLAADFVEFVLGPQGQDVLRTYHFLPPP